MGSNPPTGIPKLIIKNWLPVLDLPNTYKNRLTGQFAHKHIVVIQGYQQIQSFRIRMKQTNELICRVLFYHHYCDNIYHVYTDQMLPYNLIYTQPGIWKQEKLKIIQVFERLMKKYGYMRICRQMIGMDNSGKAKIWININPVSFNIWSKCSSQRQMVTDLMRCFQQIERQTPHNQSLKSSQIKQYVSFLQLMRTFSLNNQTQNQNICTSTILDNTTNNFNININIDLHKKKPANKLQKIFNPVLCQTFRNQNQDQPQGTSVKTNIHNSYICKLRNKQISLDPKMSRFKRKNYQQRPVSSNYNLFQIPINNLSSLNSKIDKISSYIYPRSVSQRKYLNKHERSSSKDIYPNYFKNVFNQNYQKSDFKKPFSRPQTNYNKTIPAFLLKKNTYQCENESIKKRAKTQIPDVNIYPSTQRKENTQNKKTIKQQSKLFNQYIQNFNEIVQRKNIVNSDQESVKLNFSSTLKNQINNLLESQDEKSLSPQKFKKFSFYHQNDKEFMREKDENQLIKEKVQKKKATFANLKMEALKILQDDF